MTTVATPTGRRHATLRQLPYTLLGILFLAVMLFPIYWMLNASLAPGGNALDIGLIPTNPDLSGYVQAVTDQGANLVTSVIIAVGAMLLSLAVAAPCAYALAHLRIKGTAVLLFFVLVSQMIPSIVIANALYTAYTPIGMLNTHVGLILAVATQGIPFSILIIRAYLQDFPMAIIEAARVDGAGHVRAFLSIVLPVSRNALITAGIFSFLFGWSDFLMALTLTTGESLRPVTLGLYMYIGTNNTDWGAVMATAVLSSLPAILLIALAQRYIAAGASGGAVK